jgi:hypothetical protein
MYIDYQNWNYQLKQIKSLTTVRYVETIVDHQMVSPNLIFLIASLIPVTSV